ncbi:MAG: methyltransferase domain-containing protein [bacterium]|nr:methyltransferase domain-containing protein [bacterium]
MSQQQSMQEHFRAIAGAYRQLRTCDEAPVLYIRNTFAGRRSIRAVDIGCGAGRYDIFFFRHLPKLHLTCVDANQRMLEELARYLAKNNITDFATIHASVDDLDLEEERFDAVFSFNAVHHFDFQSFLSKAARAIRNDGWLFIYTRTPSQNAETIWGQYFPSFLEKETRLYELAQMESWIRDTPRLRLDAVKAFTYRRRSDLDRLLLQARGKHYSTFSLYSNDEFEEAFEAFAGNIRRRYDNSDEVQWFDKNTLLKIGRTNAG